ncbi:serine/threonine protein kinase [Kribbella sp. NPDC055071]
MSAAMISPATLVPRATGPVATVYLMAPPAGGRTAVLKVYPEPIDKRTYQAVRDEQKVLAGLPSAGSLLLIDQYDDLPDGRSGLRMEFCPQTLTDLVAGGPLPINEVISLGHALATVLGEAHAAGLVHGGFTPANVLRRSSGLPALADFGLTLRLRFARDTLVDAAYTAPEVLRGGEPAEPSDVYGLAAVLYLALTGQSPFPAMPGDPSSGVILRALNDPVPDVSGSDVPAGLSSLLKGMFAKDPEARPTAAAVAGELQSLMLPEHSDADDELDFDDFRDELPAVRTTTPVASHYSPGVQPGLPITAPRPKKARFKRRRTKPVAAPIAPPPPVQPTPSALSTQEFDDFAAPPFNPADFASTPHPPPAAVTPPTAAGPAVTSPEVGEFDDFAGIPVVQPVVPVAPVAAAQGARPVAGTKTRWRPRRELVIAAAASIAVLAVTPVILHASHGSGAQQAAPATSAPTDAGAGTPGAGTPPVVEIVLQAPQDRHSFVVLNWKSSKPLDYAVFMAEQGGKGGPKTTYRGEGTTLTIPVSPGLKYCFEVQGTDGTATYVSSPKPIRGATCKS